MIVQDPPFDPLSDILGALNAQALCSISLRAGGDWAVDFPMPANIKINAVRRGQCWLLVKGQEATRLSPGDCIVIAGSGFTLASAPEIKPVSARDVFGSDPLAGSIGSGDDFAILGGSVTVDQADGAQMAQALPQVLVIRGGSAASIAWLLEELGREWDSGAPGARLVCADLLRMMFVQALRSYLARPEEHPPGWLAGLADPRLGRALRAIHAEPARKWTLHSLAREAGQSRSGFAALFKARLGQSPMDYLDAWRMRLAAARLRSSATPISEIGAELGYGSDSAFSAAFRRIRQTSPARYRREQQAASDLH